VARKTPPAAFRAVFGLVKIAAMSGGLVASLLSLMAIVGAFTGNGWARLSVALIVAIGVPLLLVDRLLPEDNREAAAGLSSDLLAVVWLGFPLIFAAGLYSTTRPLLLREGDRLSAAGWGRLGAAAYFIARADAGGSAAVAPVKPSKVAVRPDAAVATRPAGDGGVKARRDARPEVGPARAVERTPAELFKENAPSVVTISVTTGHGMAGGTGFILDLDGTIATNHHVVNGATAVRIKLQDGSWVDDVELLTSDEKVDLALLQIHTKTKLRPVTLGDSDKIVVGERVISIGNPLGLEHTLTDGLVSARRMFQGRPMIQMSAPVSPGNSGGPLFNMRAEVIGVTTAQLGGPWSRAQNLNLAVPVNVLKKMIQPSYPGRKKIGTDRTVPNTW
jgi:serine protease Do